MTKTLPITQARQDFPSLVDRADKKLDEFIITVNGKPAAVLISASEYESWKETNEILDNNVIMASIKKSEEQFKKGQWEDWEKVKKELKINVQD